MVVAALAQGRDFFRFIPLLTPVINKKRIQHAAFDKLLTSNLNSPAKLADLTSESLRLMELKISDLTLVSEDFGGPSGSRQLVINEALLLKSFNLSQCADRDGWFEWIRRLGIELLRSPHLLLCVHVLRWQISIIPLEKNYSMLLSLHVWMIWALNVENRMYCGRRNGSLRVP